MSVRVDAPSEAQVIAGAQAMHAAFEQRQERRDPFYTRQRWGQIGEACQREFVDYVRPALNAAWRCA